MLKVIVIIFTILFVLNWLCSERNKRHGLGKKERQELHNILDERDAEELRKFIKQRSFYSGTPNQQMIEELRKRIK